MVPSFRFLTLMAPPLLLVACSESPPPVDPRPTHALWSEALELRVEPDDDTAEALEDVRTNRWRGGQELFDYMQANRPAIEAFFEAARPERTYADAVRITAADEQKEDLGLPLLDAIALTDLMLVESQRHARGRKHEEALDHVLACLRLALQHQRAHQGVLITSVKGHGISGRALEQLRELLHWTRMTEDQLRSTLDEMLRMRRHWPGFDGIFRRDREVMRELCAEGFRRDGIDEGEQAELTIARYAELDREYTELFVRAWKERDIALVREPLDALEAELADLSARVPVPPPSGAEMADVTAKLMLHIALDSLQSSIDSDLLARVEFDMVCVALAGSLYNLDHGEFPPELELLVPDYLDELPEDPFDPGKPVKLTSSSGHWVLYSVGPDRVDQFGLMQRDRSGVGDVLSAARPHRH